MKKLNKYEINFWIKIVVALIALTISVVLIYSNAKGFFIFLGGVIVGSGLLMALRTWLWNTNKLVQQQREIKDNG